MSSGGKRYIGQYDNQEYSWSQISDPGPGIRKEIRDKVIESGWVNLLNVFEVAQQLQMQQTQQGPVPAGAVYFLVPLDLQILESKKLCVSLRVDGFFFLNDLEESDREMYLAHIKQADATLTATKARRAGIEIASAHTPVK